MKKKIIFPLVCASLLILSSCGKNNPVTPTGEPTPSVTPTPSEPSTPTPTGEPTPSVSPTPSVTPTPSKPVGPQPIDNDSDLPFITSYYEEPSVQIHYQRTEGTYKEWGLWLWADGKDGAEYEFNYQDDYGVVAYYPLSYFGNPHNLGFIVKKLFKYAGDGNWVKDGQSDRFMDIDMLKIDEHQAYHVYIKNKSSTVYTNPERTMVMNAVTTCQFINNERILLEINNPITEVVIKRNGEVAPIRKINKENSGKKLTIFLEEAADVADIFTAEVTFEDGIFCNKSVSIRNLYNQEFGEKYNYDGELGALYAKEKTTFKVWSPVSQSIELRIYDNGTPTSVDSEKGSDTYEAIPMVKGEKGVFAVEVKGDLEGKYYTYFVINSSNPEGREVVDPYARSAGVNGLRGMIVDFDKTNPTGWEAVNYLPYDRKELTVYETHIAELTCSDTWGGTPENAKLFNGFHEAGTTHTKNGVTVTTGFDHIKELGVNAVQIIPFFDQANDETNMTFNWGYNPLNYNVIEGGYSSNPYDGYVRIRELKELIKDYNEAGISIIMDVVYNHVNGLSGSNFDVLMPYYYFRYTSTGGASNGSGCGNETASDKYMFRKFMIDSVKFWTEEYKLGGFRFDLMGIHDIETMDLLTEEATKINEHICIYGEPWAGGTTALPSGFTAAVQSNASKFKGYGQFNDIMRDAMIKSGMNTLGNKGWVTQAVSKSPTVDIKDGMNGKTGTATDDPNKTVNYATCHDNYTLHDRALVAGIEGEETIAKMNMLANSVVFTSQATTFMLAGEEMLRTKIVYDVDGNPIPAKDEEGKELGYYEVSGNSYSSCYKTNEINYDWKIAHLDMFENYKKLISLKQQAEGLHSEVATNSVTSQDENSVIKTTFEYQGKTVVVYHANGTVKDTEVNINGCELYLDTLGRTLSGETHKLEPFETLIITK